MDEIRELLPLIIPILIIQLVLIVVALSDLMQRTETNGPRWFWVIIIIFFNMLGPILYFLVGRKES